MKNIRDTIKREVERSHRDEKQAYSKSEVDYSKGTTEEHCGICEHFEVLHKNGCYLVRGHIESDMWCNKFEEAGDD